MYFYLYCINIQIFKLFFNYFNIFKKCINNRKYNKKKNKNSDKIDRNKIYLNI